MTTRQIEKQDFVTSIKCESQEDPDAKQAIWESRQYFKHENDLCSK